MIHKSLKKAHIAQRYYSKRGIELEREPARKRLLLDRNIDDNILLEVLKEVAKEIQKIK